MTSSLFDNEEFDFEFWVVAFVDLLGQKEAFLKADFFPEDGDEEAEARLMNALEDSIGVIDRLHSMLDGFARGHVEARRTSPGLEGLSKEAQAYVRDTTANEVHELRLSDGVVLAASLKPRPGHSPINAIWRIFAAVGTLSLLQLVHGKPLRGGIDVGTGVLAKGQVFGPALVKAYQLESDAAKWPRILVGPTLQRYLVSVANAPGQDIPTVAGRKLAHDLMAMFWECEDKFTMLDIAGREFDALAPRFPTANAIGAATRFAKESRTRFRNENNEKLAERYDLLVKYFESPAHRR